MNCRPGAFCNGGYVDFCTKCKTHLLNPDDENLDKQ